MKENVYSRAGRLKEDRSLLLKSRADWMMIDESVTDRGECYKASINESLPTQLYEITDVRYRGEGIRSRNAYNNNGDNIYTSFCAKDFEKSSKFLGAYERSLIDVYMTPSRVDEYVGSNFTSTFILDSSSDIYSGLSVESCEETFEEDYWGSFKMSTKLFKKHSFYRSDEDIEDWSDFCICGGDFSTKDIEEIFCLQQ